LEEDEDEDEEEEEKGEEEEEEEEMKEGGKCARDNKSTIQNLVPRT